MSVVTAAAPLLGRIPVTLSWRDDDGAAAVADAAAVYRVHLDGALGQLLDRAAPSAAQELTAAWEAASDVARHRVLTAPSVSWRLLWTPQRPVETTRYILQALAHERAADARTGEVADDSWSVLGDRFLTAGTLPALPVPVPAPPLRRDGAGGQHFARERSTVFSAPVAAGMPVDWRSPLARVQRVGGCPEADRPWPELDDEAGARAVAGLRTAFAGIAATSEVASALVTTMTAVVVCRAIGDRFISSTGLRELGRTVIVNAHSPRSTPVRLAEALVHESIHDLNAISEQAAPWVEDDRVQGVEVISPWTGRQLPLRTFLHACLVWCGLHNFWTLALERGPFETEDVVARLTEAVKGFERGAVLDHIPRVARVHVNPQVADVIERAELGTGQRHW